MNVNNDAKMLVSFWGTRGSVSTPGRITEKYGGNTPCVSVRYQDIQVIFDAGTGIRNLGLDLLDELERKGRMPSLHIFLSHTHWDHIQGLPFFAPSYQKDTVLTIYGSSHKGRFLSSILHEQMDYEYFPVSMSSLKADINIKEIKESKIRLGALTIECQEQVFHPGGSVRYKVSLNDRKIVYASDVELDKLFNSEEENEENRKLIQEFMDFISEADLLIADAQYTEEEYPQKVGWGHTSVPVLLDAAYRSNVKQLAIFHHDPQHSDKFLDELYIKNRSKYLEGDQKMDLFWAREGISLSI
jgi:phosphoribosyl 1,2-cyclic phosphodiesterase